MDELPWRLRRSLINGNLTPYFLGRAYRIIIFITKHLNFDCWVYFTQYYHYSSDFDMLVEYAVTLNSLTII